MTAILAVDPAYRIALIAIGSVILVSLAAGAMIAAGGSGDEPRRPDDMPSLKPVPLFARSGLPCEFTTLPPAISPRLSSTPKEARNAHARRYSVHPST